MKKILPVFIPLGIIFLSILLLGGRQSPILDPKGIIAIRERQLLVFGPMLGAFIVVPVIILLIIVSSKYSSSRGTGKYTPDFTAGGKLQFIWWLVPSIIIIIMTVLTWKYAHDLDPFKPLAAENPPLTIQVVALRWKWLFIYPDQGIATVNFVEFPVGTPVNFELTADAPMNSFWIPQLSGQIYSMPGMSTQLHLMADSPGDFSGGGAEISGAGFSGMRFTARSVSPEDFDSWVGSVHTYPEKLSFEEYSRLSGSGGNSPVLFYSAVDNDLYNKIIAQYLDPQANDKNIPVKGY